MKQISIEKKIKRRVLLIATEIVMILFLGWVLLSSAWEFSGREDKKHAADYAERLYERGDMAGLYDHLLLYDCYEAEYDRYWEAVNEELNAGRIAYWSELKEHIESGESYRGFPEAAVNERLTELKEAGARK